MKTNKRNTIFVIGASVIFITIIILLVAFTLSGVFDNNALLEALLIAALVLAAALLAVTLFLFLNQYALIKTLQVENAYIFGKKSDFNGYMMINVNGEEKKVLIHDTHLEEDTAKMDHYTDYSLLDYNRCGVPLLETVTEPCLNSADEAVAFLEGLRNIFLYFK